MTINTAKLVRVNNKRYIKLPRNIQPTKIEMHYFRKEKEAMRFVGELGWPAGIEIERLGNQWLVVLQVVKA